MKYRAAIVGATGMVGQRFITLLHNHPWFEISALVASGRSAGRTYAQAVEGRWKMPVPIPDAVRDMVVMDSAQRERVAECADFIFCAVDMPKAEIRAMEEAFARLETPVVSNNSACRGVEDVPMLVPEINGRAHAGDRGAAQTPGHPARLHRLQAQLFHSGLCARAHAPARFWPEQNQRVHLSGRVRRGENAGNLAGNGR